MGATFSKLLSFCSGEGFGVSRPWQFGLAQSFVQIFSYFGPNLLLYIAGRNGWIKQWKITEGGPPAALAQAAVKKNISDFFMMIFLGRFVFYNLLTLGKKQISDKKEKAVDDTVPVKKEGEGEKTPAATHEKIGWSNLRFSGPRPSVLKMIGTVLLAYLGYDFMFYWSHRMLHLPRFYRKVHREHHRFINTIGPAASYAHIVEDTMQLLNWYVPIGAAGYLFGDLHMHTLTAYNAFRWLETLDAHSGYSLPFSLFTLLPVFSGALGHDFHHTHWKGNFGATPFWDWLCGTDAPYKEFLAKKLIKTKS